GRTPALDRVLQQEAGHHEWQEQRAARAARRGKGSGQGERGRVRLDGALDVPFAIEFREARGNLSAVLCKIEQVALDLAVDAAVDLRVGVAAYPAAGGWDRFRHGHRMMLRFVEEMSQRDDGSEPHVRFGPNDSGWGIVLVRAFVREHGLQ